MAAFFTELERRLREEIERKVTIVEQSPAKPTVAQVQERIKKFGDKCHEFEDRLTQAKLDFIELKGNRWEMTYTVKESINYMLKLKDMRAKHLDELRELIHWMDQFYLAHEWYEILVAVGNAQELDRLMFLDALGQDVTMRPTRPTDRGYPLPQAVYNSYLKDDVGRIVQSYRRGYETLTHDEKEELYDVEQETTRSRAAEMRAYQEVQQTLAEFTDEWRRQREQRQQEGTGPNGRDSRRLEEAISQLRSEICQQHEQTRKWIEEAYNQAVVRMAIERKEGIRGMKEEIETQLEKLQQNFSCLEQQFRALGVQFKEESERRGRQNSELLGQLTNEISKTTRPRREDSSKARRQEDSPEARHREESPEERRRPESAEEQRREDSSEARRREDSLKEQRREESPEERRRQESLEKRRRRERRHSPSTDSGRSRRDSPSDHRGRDHAEGRKRKRSEHRSTDEGQQYEELLANYHEELERTEEELRKISCPERRIGDRGTKAGQFIMCVFCMEYGQHYSDACPRVTSIADRVSILDNEGRCHRCLERHLNTCQKSTLCFYCKNVSRSTAYDHHAGICPLPDEVERLRSHKRELEETIHGYRRKLQKTNSDKDRVTGHSEDYPGPSHS